MSTIDVDMDGCHIIMTTIHVGTSIGHTNVKFVALDRPLDLRGYIICEFHQVFVSICMVWWLGQVWSRSKLSYNCVIRWTSSIMRWKWTNDKNEINQDWMKSGSGLGFSNIQILFHWPHKVNSIHYGTKRNTNKLKDSSTWMKNE